MSALLHSSVGVRQRSEQWANVLHGPDGFHHAYDLVDPRVRKRRPQAHAEFCQPFFPRERKAPKATRLVATLLDHSTVPARHADDCPCLVEVVRNIVAEI